MLIKTFIKKLLEGNKMEKKLKMLGKLLIISFLFSSSLLVLFCLASKNPVIVVSTELGKFKIEIFIKEAPLTASNFLKYVDNHLYDGGFFYRTVNKDNDPEKEVKISVVQGGMSGDESKKAFPPIEHETTEKTGILHKDGVISMARNRPGSATSEFFICIENQPELDFGGKRNPDGQGFAAFGKVIEGMDVVKKVHSQPADGQRLNPKIKINYMKRKS